MVRPDDEQHEAAMVNEPDDDICGSESTTMNYIADSDEADVTDSASDIGRFATDLLESDFYYFSASVLSDQSFFLSFIKRLTGHR